MTLKHCSGLSKGDYLPMSDGSSMVDECCCLLWGRRIFSDIFSYESGVVANSPHSFHFRVCIYVQFLLVALLCGFTYLSLEDSPNLSKGKLSFSYSYIPETDFLYLLLAMDCSLDGINKP